MEILITIHGLPDAPDDPVVAAAGEPQEKIVCEATLSTAFCYIGTTGHGTTPAAAFRVALADILCDLNKLFAGEWRIVADPDVVKPLTGDETKLAIKMADALRPELFRLEDELAGGVAGPPLDRAKAVARLALQLLRRQEGGA